MRDDIWLCGASGKVSFEESNWWRLFCQLWLENNSRNFRGINPNDYYNYREQLHDSDDEIKEFCKQRVKQAKVILVNLKNTKDSGGTLMEVAWADVWGKPIVGFYDGDKIDLSKVTYCWVPPACNKIKTGKEAMLDALNYIEKYYG